MFEIKQIICLLVFIYIIMQIKDSGQSSGVLFFASFKTIYEIYFINSWKVDGIKKKVKKLSKESEQVLYYSSQKSILSQLFLHRDFFFCHKSGRHFSHWRDLRLLIKNYFIPYKNFHLQSTTGSSEFCTVTDRQKLRTYNTKNNKEKAFTGKNILKSIR